MAAMVIGLFALPIRSQTTPSPDSYTVEVNVAHRQPTGVAEGGVSIEAGQPGYRFCKSLIGVALSPAGPTPTDGDVGYRLVNSSQQLLEWQWWTDAKSGLAEINGKFAVVWAKTSLSQAERMALGCTALHGPEPVKTFSGKVARLPLQRGGSAVLPGVPLTEWTSGRFQETEEWNGGRIEKRVTVKTTNADRYVFCKLRVDVETRSPDDEPPAQSGLAGYRLVEVNSTRLVWQAWVRQHGRLWGPDTWLTADFSVKWIRKDAFPEHRQAEGCSEKLPDPSTPYEEPKEGTGTAPTQPRQSFIVFLRRTCKDTQTQKIRGSSDLLTHSPTSCAAARAIAEATDAARDICRNPNSGDVVPYSAETGPPDWKYTDTCPSAGK